MNDFVDLEIEGLTDKELLSNVLVLRKRERLTLKTLLEHLEEVYRRRVFADLGYSSLFKYLVKELGYSEGAASRRIGALKLIKKDPVAKKMIASGELSLAVANVAHHFLKNDQVESHSVLKRLACKNHDEAKHEVLKIQEELVKRGDNEMAKPCIKKDVKVRESSTTTRVHLSLDNETLDLLEELKALSKSDTNSCLKDSLRERIASLKDQKLGVGVKNRSRKDPLSRSRYIPIATRREVLKRSSFSCEYPGCTERRHLEFEHVNPFSLGGNHESENLKLFCRAHNQRSGIVSLGLKAMEPFLST